MTTVMSPPLISAFARYALDFWAALMPSSLLLMEMVPPLSWIKSLECVLLSLIPWMHKTLIINVVDESIVHMDCGV